MPHVGWPDATDEVMIGRAHEDPRSVKGAVVSAEVAVGAASAEGAGVMSGAPADAPGEMSAGSLTAYSQTAARRRRSNGDLRSTYPPVFRVSEAFRARTLEWVCCARRLRLSACSDEDRSRPLAESVVRRVASALFP